MDLTDVNLLLGLLNILILLVCLYIIRDILINIQRSTIERSASAILYLRSNLVLRGFKILMVGIFFWSIREVIGFIRDYMSPSEFPGYSYVGGLPSSVFGVLGLFTAVFLSYGLYIISVSFRTHTRGWVGDGGEKGG